MAVGAVAGTTADKPADLQGPSLTTQTDKASQAEEATQPDDAAQADDSTQSKKSAEPKKKPDAAKPEKKPDAAEPEKKSDVPAESGRKEADAGAKSAQEGRDGRRAVGPGMMKLLQDEIVAGIKRRGITDRFARFQSYAAGRVSATAGNYTGSELTGNCRLRWYDHLMRNMLAAPAEAEQFTRELHMAVRERPRRAGPGAGHRGGEDGRRPAEAAQVRPADLRRAGAGDRSSRR